MRQRERVCVCVCVCVLGICWNVRKLSAAAAAAAAAYMRWTKLLNGSSNLINLVALLHSLRAVTDDAAQAEWTARMRDGTGSMTSRRMTSQPRPSDVILTDCDVSECP